jgi:predicted RNA-binding Zn-ribbon protein involved in translation (DUF1610 family)
MDKPQPAQTSGAPVVTPRDILFECPSCGKSMVIDQAAEGYTIECPQCHIPVIVPPKTGAAPQPPLPPSLAAAAKAAPAPKPAGSVDVAGLQEQLTALNHQLREQGTQWTELTSRIAGRINEINHDLVLLARLEASQKQILSQWSQIVAKIGAASQPPIAGVKH